MHIAVRSSHGKRARAPKPCKHVIKMFSTKPIVPHILLRACVAVDYVLGSLQTAQYCLRHYCLIRTSDMSAAFCASTAGHAPSCKSSGQIRNTVMLRSEKSGIVQFILNSTGGVLEQSLAAILRSAASSCPKGPNRCGHVS